MGEIAKQQLQSVFARRECHGGLGLAATEMAMLIVLGHRLSQIRQRRIDQQVMMTGVIQLVAARLYTRPPISARRAAVSRRCSWCRPSSPSELRFRTRQKHLC